jgi:hypothetical protein
LLCNSFKKEQPLNQKQKSYTTYYHDANKKYKSNLPMLHSFRMLHFSANPPSKTNRDKMKKGPMQISHEYMIECISNENHPHHYSMLIILHTILDLKKRNENKESDWEEKLANGDLFLLDQPKGEQ